jgi:broad specificity phosphatase PhoE
VNHQIVLIRHGRSAHVHTGWIDVHGFRRWREAYEAAGILPSEAPPPELCALAARTGAVAASDTPRAVQSARLLAPDRQVLVTPLLRELELAPPALPGLRLPLAGWAVAVGVRWLYFRFTSGQHVSAAELDRARDAAEWLAGLAQQHGSVAAVTHASFRGLVGGTLAASGWQGVTARRRYHHWSVWTYTRPASGRGALA